MARRRLRALPGALAGVLLLGAIPHQERAPQTRRFVAHEIATGLRGGYQTIAVDLNKDGKLDLIAVASGVPELVWFENPTWTRHVLARGMPGLINVAATDLDGDGIPELAVAYGFTTSPATSTGIVSLLTHGPDVNQPWTVKEIDRVPTSHRLRWFAAPRGERWLLNSPLAGAAARPPAYEGNTPIYVYRPPEWRRDTVTNAEHGVVHAIEVSDGGRRSPLVVPSIVAPPRPMFFSAGFDGVHQYAYDSVRAVWRRERMTAGAPGSGLTGGASDIGWGLTVQTGGTNTNFVATIEPWHGTMVAVHWLRGGGTRSVIDSTIDDGHTILVADFNHDAQRPSIVVGQRGGTRTLWLYTIDSLAFAPLGTPPVPNPVVRWKRTAIDPNMGAAGCVAADLNNDGWIDLACIATATANLKWYENVPATPTPGTGARRR